MRTMKMNNKLRKIQSLKPKKRIKRKEKGLKALLNDNASNTKKNNAYKNKKPYYSNNNNQSNQYKNNEYEPKNFITVEEII